MCCGLPRFADPQILAFTHGVLRFAAPCLDFSSVLRGLNAPALDEQGAEALAKVPEWVESLLGIDAVVRRKAAAFSPAKRRAPSLDRAPWTRLIPYAARIANQVLVSLRGPGQATGFGEWHLAKHPANHHRDRAELRHQLG